MEIFTNKIIDPISRISVFFIFTRVISSLYSDIEIPLTNIFCTKTTIFSFIGFEIKKQVCYLPEIYLIIPLSLLLNIIGLLSFIYLTYDGKILQIRGVPTNKGGKQKGGGQAQQSQKDGNEN